MNKRRVFWFLTGNKNTGSSRIHGYNIHEALLKKGIHSKILKAGNKKPTFKQKIKYFLHFKKGDLLVVQKVKKSWLKQILILLKLRGVSIAYIDCDLPKCDDTIVKHIDYIICTSKNLTELYKQKHPDKKITYIPDAVEFYSNYLNKSNNAIYFGWLTQSRLQKIEELKPIFKFFGRNIYTMSNKEPADIIWRRWEDIRTYEIISKYSISIIPIDETEESNYKSANRVLQSFALGNIVLCGDLKSYKEVISNGVNGFICSNEMEWKKALIEISDEKKRNEIIKNGYETAQKFSIDNIIMEWISFLKL